MVEGGRDSHELKRAVRFLIRQVVHNGVEQNLD
jgi:hypothetical protein